MLHVGYDIRPALFDYAGVGRYVRELAVALTNLPDDEGPFLEMFASSWRGGRKIPPGLRKDRCRMHRGPLPGRVMELLNRVPGLDAGRVPAKVDVFHWTDYTYPAVRTAARVMTLHDAAFVMDPQFHGWDTAKLLMRVRHAIAQADRVIVPSEPSRTDAELLGVHDDQVVVVPHGVSPFFKPGPGRLGDGDYLLTVGTLEPRKNYLRTLLAMEKLWARDAAPDWVIIGRRGWDYEGFLERMEGSKYRSRIRWIEHLSDTELLRHYQGALAFLFPSLHEGFGLAVLEAMACGVAPVVGEGTAPAWVAGDSAMLVVPKDVDSIAEGVERIVHEHAWRRQAAAVALRRARTFTWERTARETHAVYHQAVERHRARGPVARPA